MGVNLNLYTGLRITNAEAMLTRKFSEWAWENYDGDHPHNPNVIDPKHDIDRMYHLGVRTSRILVENMVKRSSTKLTKCLKQLPLDQPLEDVNLKALEHPITELFDIVLTSKGIKIAAGTKLLFPFRPQLLPVVDSLIDYYYWYAISIKEEATFRELEKAETWGKYIYEIIKLIQRDLNSVRDEIDRIRTNLKGQAFAKASRLRILESLIWYYYAREGENYNGHE